MVFWYSGIYKHCKCKNAAVDSCSYMVSSTCYTQIWYRDLWFMDDIQKKFRCYTELVVLKDWWIWTETYSESYQASKMELFAKIVNGWKPLTIFAKSSILDVWQCCIFRALSFIWSWCNCRRVISKNFLNVWRLCYLLLLSAIRI